MAKTCLKCGNTLEDTAKFCPKCGSEYGAVPTCVKCGQKLTANDRFCPNCGADQSGKKPSPVGAGEDYIKKGFDTFASAINTMAGESGQVEIHLKDLYSEVFKKHTQEEKDELFVCGTSKTTPKESEMITEWPRPWLYTRVFLMFAVVFAGLYFMSMNLHNANIFPGAMFVGALLVPLTVIIFFWEMNVPRNISIMDVVSVFFVGGVLSLVLALLLFEIFPSTSFDLAGATLIGIVEEVGKALAVAYYIKTRNPKYKLNGLLLGACVGGGFAVFETAGYAFRIFISTNSLPAMMHNLFLRGVLAIGCHVVWTAISGFGLVVAKGDAPLQTNHLLSAKFLKFLVLVIALHAAWDWSMPFITTQMQQNLKLAVLILIAVATVLILLSAGLRQVSAIVQKAQAEERAAGSRL
jgi:RsiW-degrading membrane proteinase PrsW (M82 family)/RNA polymerase subunit RPABC4/transcription elongation factor Spt4